MESDCVLVEKAVNYITKSSYSPNATKNEKRVIRKKAEKLSVKDGEVFYKKKGGKEAGQCMYYSSLILQTLLMRKGFYSWLTLSFIIQSLNFITIVSSIILLHFCVNVIVHENCRE